MSVWGLARIMAIRGAVALTPTERWSAARHGSAADVTAWILEHVFLIATTSALIFLILLLWLVTHRRRPTVTREVTREAFTAKALRCGLSPRERQILLAIVMRSGLGQSDEIFTMVDAFDRGTTRLLAECGRTRKPHEIERLKIEVTGLRQKLGFHTRRTSGRLAQSRRPSSRDIPAGKRVGVIWQRHRDDTLICGEVVRNDDIELAIELEKPVSSQAGDVWRVRYAYGASLWEYDTTAVACEERRLVLNHVDQVRFVNRRRFTRVEVRMPAAVAAFPFQRRGVAGTLQTSPAESRTSVSAPEFVPGIVTELAGPGLRIEALLRVCAGERVLVVFRPNEGTEPGYMVGPVSRPEYVIEDIGVVRHCHEMTDGFSIAVELAGLTETDIDALVRLTNAMGANSHGSDSVDRSNSLEEAADLATVSEI